MSNENNTMNLLILDLIGSAFMGFGLYELFGGSPLMPEAFQMPLYEFVLIGIGFWLVIPYFKHVINQAQEKNKQNTD